MLDLDRYLTLHVLLFVIGNCIILLLMVFETTIFSFLKDNLRCFKNLQTQFEQMDAISDDYYEEITLKFLVSEYERTKQEK